MLDEVKHGQNRVHDRVNNVHVDPGLRLGRRLLLLGWFRWRRSFMLLWLLLLMMRRLVFVSAIRLLILVLLLLFVSVVVVSILLVSRCIFLLLVALGIIARLVLLGRVIFLAIISLLVVIAAFRLLLFLVVLWLFLAIVGVRRSSIRIVILAVGAIFGLLWNWLWNRLWLRLFVKKGLVASNERVLALGSKHDLLAIEVEHRVEALQELRTESINTLVGCGERDPAVVVIFSWWEHVCSWVDFDGDSRCDVQLQGRQVVDDVITFSVNFDKLDSLTEFILLSKP